jgi:hypothetical protein
MDYTLVVEGTYLVQREVTRYGTDQVLDTGELEVKIDTVGKVYENKSGALLDQFDESQCALIYQNKPVLKFFLGELPTERYLSRLFFKKI